MKYYSINMQYVNSLHCKTKKEERQSKQTKQCIESLRPHPKNLKRKKIKFIILK